MKFEDGIGHIYSGKVGVYNPKIVPTAPASYKDVFDPDQGSKLGILDIQYQYTLVAAALAAGGSDAHLAPGKKLLLECRQPSDRISPTHPTFDQGLNAEACSIGLMRKARGGQLQQPGPTQK